MRKSKLISLLLVFVLALSIVPSIPVGAATHRYVDGVCSDCGAKLDGLCKVNGVWGYYVGGKLQTTKSGIVQKADKSSANWYYVKKGIYTKASGLARKADGSSTTWYYVKDGVYTKASGIAKMADGSSSDWFYVLNGTYSKRTGIAQKADGSSATWYFVKSGLYTKSTGIAKKADGSSTTWYYVKSGVYTKATGIAQRADGASSTWYYVKSGIWTKITGKVVVASKQYQVASGIVDINSAKPYYASAAAAYGAGYVDFNSYKIGQYPVELADGKITYVYGYYLPEQSNLIFKLTKEYRESLGRKLSRGTNQAFADTRAREATYQVWKNKAFDMRAHQRPNGMSIGRTECIASTEDGAYAVRLWKASTAGHHEAMINPANTILDTSCFVMVSWDKDRLCWVRENGVSLQLY